MIYDISNPSDPYTLKADDFATATAAVLLLGRGHYGLTSEDGTLEVPLFLLGGSEAWLEEQGFTIPGLIDGHELEIAQVLDSVLIGTFGARREVESALAKMSPEDGEKWLAERHERKRSSMNDIGAQAKAIAKTLRKKVEAANA